jgi:putative transposase
MRCIGCGSIAVSERSERTTQGYRRFRCRDCGKQFNECSESLLNRTQYPSDVIALVVLWQLRYRVGARIGSGAIRRCPRSVLSNA